MTSLAEWRALRATIARQAAEAAEVRRSFEPDNGAPVYAPSMTAWSGEAAIYSPEYLWRKYGRRSQFE